MNQIGQFLHLVDVFCDGRLAEATLSTRIFNDGKRIAALRAGGDIGTRPLARAIDWLSLHWPEGEEWPSDIPRPVHSQPETMAAPAE
jgi:hypothetical protein